MKRYCCAMLLTVGLLGWLWNTLEYWLVDKLEGSVPLMIYGTEG